MIKNNKIGLFTDLHIGLGQDSSSWHDVVLEFGKWSSEIYLKRGINDIIICGDVFHNRSEISVATLDVAKRFFDCFRDFQIYILAGNHDSYFKDHSEVNSISLLDGWKNIKVVQKNPETLKIKDKSAVLVPWGVEYQDIPTADIIFGHFEIVSFYMNTYKKCEHGMSSNDLFDKSKLIISGHFHKKEHRKYNNGEIIYLGSPYQQNFGDSLDERGIYILDIEKNEFEFIENDISPKYYKISVNDLIKNDEKASTLIEKTNKNRISLLVDSPIEPEQLLQLQSKIHKNTPIELRIDYTQPDLKINKDGVEKNLDFVNILDDMEKYIDTIDIKNKEDVFSYIKQIYNLKTT